ncbi:NADH-quinone oxidoreductase subunit C [Candidatus Methylospira mobilis]|uniref:hydrogenase large subunit n=1 Tax=Candidatus Methylospira mobilis TaxID=1808979 RepID=UPI0028E767A5|nr:NADH-quinone oxidoreductase subunit C [Candidatus Methylospira mobilis]WNV05677.1 NADH-quinone oxidoreductase subunit C [Candidatus Methylospira mobilis]
MTQTNQDIAVAIETAHSQPSEPESLAAALRAQKIDVELIESTASFPAVVKLNAADWGNAAAAASAAKWRWAGVWADDCVSELKVYSCLQKNNTYLILQTQLRPGQTGLTSQAPYFWAADRPERHTQDLFGIRFEDHPDPRRWTRHQAWPQGSYPLRKSFPASGLSQAETAPDHEYPFLEANGDSVYQIPVGPVHAGIIEPGHFRFQAIGETVLHLEERLGYVHKGIEKISEGRDPAGLARLAGRVSGDCTVAHAWAACLAMERAAGFEAPPRAAFLRGIMAERERIGNHLWDMAALCNDVGFAFAYYQFGRLRELWLRENQSVFGHRLLMDRIVPGGVISDISSQTNRLMRESVTTIRGEVNELLTILDYNSSLEDRFIGAGMLSVELADALGALGFVGRASGQTFDARAHIPYAPYDSLQVRVPVESQGDVASRFWVRYKELRESFHLIEALLDTMPYGDVSLSWQAPAAGAQGFAAIESWRGEVLCFVRFDGDNAVSRYWPRDPSAVNWPALEKLVLGNIVPDFPVCNKSVNASYSGHDL